MTILLLENPVIKDCLTPEDLQQIWKHFENEFYKKPYGDHRDNVFIDIDDRKNCFNILEIPEDADCKALKTAFMKKSMQYHPDKNATAEATERFKEINTANAKLKNYIKLQELTKSEAVIKAAPLVDNPAIQTVHQSQKKYRKRDAFLRFFKTALPTVATQPAKNNSLPAGIHGKTATPWNG
jgi:DnaJ-class molecular chaperone